VGRVRAEIFDPTQKSGHARVGFFDLKPNTTRPNPKFMHKKLGLTQPDLNLTTYRVELGPKNPAQWSGQAELRPKEKIRWFLLTRPGPMDDQVYFEANCTVHICFHRGKQTKRGTL
jgi:hypothetical protein